MKKVLILLILFLSFTYADSVKHLTLACNSYEDIINTKNISETMKDGAIPRNCMLLTSNANVSIVDNNLEDKRIVKIFVHDLEEHLFTTREDVIITNENKI